MLFTWPGNHPVVFSDNGQVSVDITVVFNILSTNLTGDYQVTSQSYQVQINPKYQAQSLWVTVNGQPKNAFSVITDTTASITYHHHLYVFLQ